MLEKALKKPIEYDEDNPELTPERLSQLRRVSELNREERRKQKKMIVRHEIDFSKGLTLEQLEMLEKLKDFPDEPDEDFPELTDEQLSQMRRVSELNREERRKQTVTLRLSPQALRKAKSLGKGYTSVLSRILENALMDNEIIEKNL